MLVRYPSYLMRVVVLLCVFSYGAGAVSPLVLNELMAINDDAWPDPQGDYDDWVELHNSTDQPVRADGFFLTDNFARLTKWRIGGISTEEIWVPARGYLVIWVDNDTKAGPLHASFCLSGNGEGLALVDRGGSVMLDAVTFPGQSANVSYGRFPDAIGDWQFMETSSPGATNQMGYEAVAGEVLFSHRHGFYEEPVTVTLSTNTPEAEIWYTIDHQSLEIEPQAGSNNTTTVRAGKRYTEPIVVSRTTCIRARTVREGWKDSVIRAQTYLFLDDVIKQSDHPAGYPDNWGNNSDFGMDQRVVEDPAYRDTIIDDLKTIPSICLTLANNDIFGNSRGIFNFPGYRGVDWERLATIEWLDPNTGDEFSINAGLRVHGRAGRNPSIAKHSLRILFKEEYGPAVLAHPLFPDTDVTTFDSLVLRACWNYTWIGESGMGGPCHAQYMRDAFCRDTARDMGLLVPHGRHVHVYINGLYWGLYLLIERPDEDFAAAHLGGDKDDYEVLQADRDVPLQMEVMAGDIKIWQEMFALAEEDLSQDANYLAMQAYVNVPDLIDYMLLVFYTGSRDAPTLLDDSSRPNNFFAIRSVSPPSGFTFQVWDMEWCLEETTVNRVPFLGGHDNPTALFGALGDHPDFRQLVGDHVHRHFVNGGVLTAEVAGNRYWNRIMDIDRAIVGESARWGDARDGYAYTRDREWVQERERLMTDYFPVRTNTVLEQLRHDGWYPNVAAPVFYVNSDYQHGGEVVAGASLTIDHPNQSGLIYYTLNRRDPRKMIASEGTDVVLVPEQASKRVWIPVEDIGLAWTDDVTFDDSTWLLSPGGVGFDLSWTPSYDIWIDLDLESAMWDQNASCYWRTVFSAEQVEQLMSMELRVRFDDAFVAFLNGVKIAESGAPTTLTWNSAAEYAHEASGDFTVFDVSQALALLKESGPNVLAIHGLNATANSTDFLLAAELVAVSGFERQGLRYTGPISLEKSATVKAAVLQGNHWSALNEADFVVLPPTP